MRLTVDYVRAVLLAWVLLICGMGAAISAPYAAMVMDARTGEVLHSRNAETPLHPASLTKMMTLYIAFQAIERGEIRADTMVTITSQAAAEPPSKLGLRTGQKIRLRDLIRAAAVKSANDAATAIGIAISGSEAAFTQRMTQTARAMGMRHTRFLNANGLTQSGHMSTARDMSILGRHMIYDYPQFYNLFSRESTDTAMGTVRNTNRRLLNGYRGADGIKTGYTRAAGYNLVASAERGNVRIIATVFGGTSSAQRYQRVSELLDLGFSRAPSSARVRRPQKPGAFSGGGGQAPSNQGTSGALVASATQTTRARTAPVTAVRQSPRPNVRTFRLRRQPETVLAQTTTRPAAPAPQLAPEAVAEASQIASALSEALGQAASTPPAPQAPAPETVTAVIASAAPATRPAAQAAQPAPAADEALVAQILADVAETAQETELAVAQPQSGAVARSPAPRARPAETNIALVSSDAGITREEATAPAAQAPLRVTVQPAPAAPATSPAPAAPVAVAVAPPPPPAATVTVEPTQPAEAEVVTRSGNGTGSNGIYVGRYSSRYEAERALMRIALNEMDTLSGAQRRVVQTNRGFEARFTGLNSERASRACSRLSAKSIECSTL